MGVNDAAWEKLFDKYRILEEIGQKGCFPISAAQIKEFREPRLMTKFDHRVNLPAIFAENRLSILPVTRGDYLISTFASYQDFDPPAARACRISVPSHIQSLAPRFLSSEAIALNCAGACGILPAVLFGMREEYDLSRGELQLALLTASGVGAVITKNATVSGAEGGCQAECGVAAAMAASAAVFLANGTNEASIHAVAFALMNAMGLVCDPIAGLVQVPCAQRNASQAVNALVAADLALAGMRSVIPPDEVVEAMLKVGHMLPDALKETAQGGIAATPTGKRIAKRIFPEETK